MRLPAMRGHPGEKPLAAGGFSPPDDAAGLFSTAAVNHNPPSEDHNPPSEDHNPPSEDHNPPSVDCGGKLRGKCGFPPLSTTYLYFPPLDYHYKGWFSKLQGLSQIFEQGFSKKFVGFSINPLSAYKKHPILEISSILDFVRLFFHSCAGFPCFSYFYLSSCLFTGLSPVIF
ncbi:MAG TPA: hypothetical protein H9694_05045 [Firmicutes bacterium]|nr:hypothetical protein [Bacillota bacterium]